MRSYWVLLLVPALASTVLAQQVRNRDRPQYPSFDGSDNNVDHPTWGKTYTPFIRHQVPAVANEAVDGLGGANRPSPRAISLALLNKPYFKATSAFNSSYLLTALGQLVSHDITRGGSSSKSNGGSAPIPVPPGDPLYWKFSNQVPVSQGSRQSLPYMRTNFTRLRPGGVRQQVNEASSWLDASCLYGEVDAVVDIIRAGTAGRLLMDESKLLPLNVERSTGKPKHIMKNYAERLPQTQLRLSGNNNVNQNPLVMTLVTVLLREHNRRALELEAGNPDWDDDKIFDEARKWVIAHFQRIALTDYLAALGIALPPYRGYNASVDPSIDNFFSTVAYRYGHSTIGDVIMRLDETWSEHPKGHLTMRQTYYNPNIAMDAGLEPLIRGLIVQSQGRIEPRWATSVSGNLAGDAVVNGTDLAAINIQRGRDHGIPDYNSCRRALGLAPAKTFSDITPDPKIARILENLYTTVNDVDAYVGGLAEPPQGSSHLGPLFTASIQEQFTRLRDADWWYYENGVNNKLFTQQEIDEIKQTDLRQILQRTTSIKDLPKNIWKAGNGMTCEADSSGSNLRDGGAGSGRNKREKSLLSGSASLTVEPIASDPGWVNVQLTSKGSGWLGFGVAQAGSGNAMIGADMVAGRMVDGAPQVRRYHAVGLQPPVELPEDSSNSRLKNVKFEQSGGQVKLQFHRPTSGGGDNELPMPVNGRMRLIVARGPNNNIDSIDGVHGVDNREVIQLDDGLFGTSSTPAADRDAIKKRRAHGVLMAVNFVVIFPLGALGARQLRSHWLRSPAIRASLFYVHIVTQVVGTACVIASFVIATRTFKVVTYRDVDYGHGKLGVATLALVASQLLLGFLRPTATAPTVRRQIWDMIHSTLGRAAMLIGLANVGLGVLIFSNKYSGNFGIWAGLCLSGVGAISLLQYILDRQEKYAVLKNDREMALLAASAPDGRTDDGFDDTPHKPGAHGSTGPNHELEPTPFHDTAAPSDQYGGVPPATGGLAAGGGAAAGSAALSPKLTATLLQRHEATSGAPDSNGVGLSHPGFCPSGRQSDDLGNAGWDHGEAAAMPPAAAAAAAAAGQPQQRYPGW